jgi:hypothetical protein
MAIMRQRRRLMLRAVQFYAAKVARHHLTIGGL